MAFGTVIKKLRERSGISVDKLAGKIGVSPGRWRKWEEKDYEPRDEDRRKIEAFFGMAIDDFYALDSISNFLEVPELKVRVDGAGISVGPEESPTIEKLSQALADQAAAEKIRAAGYTALVDTLRLQAELLKDIRSEMAREKIQVNMQANLDEVRSIVDKISKTQNDAIHLLRKEFADLRAMQPAPIKGRQ